MATTIGYRLNTNTDIKISFFNMFGYKLASLSFDKGLDGGSKGYNKIEVNLSTFNNNDLPTGVYFYIISANGKALAKGKMVIKR